MVLLTELNQRLFRHIQQFCGTSPCARPDIRPYDAVFFRFRISVGQVFGSLRLDIAENEVIGRYGVAVGMEGSHENCVLQFSYIAGPGIEFQSLDCRCVESLFRLGCLMRIYCEKIIGNVRNILGHLA